MVLRQDVGIRLRGHEFDFQSGQYQVVTSTSLFGWMTVGGQVDHLGI